VKRKREREEREGGKEAETFKKSNKTVRSPEGKENMESLIRGLVEEVKGMREESRTEGRK